VAANDLLALGTLDAAAAAGLHCPDDLSIVGMNDMPLSDRVQPPLTTVRVGEYELGRQAARLLLAHIERPDRDPETILITPELVVRESSAKPAARESGAKPAARESDGKPAARESDGKPAGRHSAGGADTLVSEQAAARY
jgi:LacI family transcriptional regulator